MTMKRTELEKRAGLRIAHQTKHQDARALRADAVPLSDRRARRAADRAAGLVPLAVKLPSDLLARLRATATHRGVTVDALIAESLDRALPNDIAQR